MSSVRINLIESNDYTDNDDNIPGVDTNRFNMLMNRYRTPLGSHRNRQDHTEMSSHRMSSTNVSP